MDNKQTITLHNSTIGSITTSYGSELFYIFLIITISISVMCLTLYYCLNLNKDVYHEDSDFISIGGNLSSHSGSLTGVKYDDRPRCLYNFLK